MNFFKVCGVIVAWVLVATAAHAESISGMRGGPAYRDGIRDAQLRGYGYNDAISPVVRGFGGPVWSTVNENDVLPRDGNTLREVKSEAYVQISRKGVESDANGSVSGEPGWPVFRSDDHMVPLTCATDVYSSAHTSRVGSVPARSCAFGFVQNRATGDEPDNYSLAESAYSKSGSFGLVTAGFAYNYQNAIDNRADGLKHTPTSRAPFVLPACTGPRWIVTVRSLLRRQKTFPLVAQRRLLDSPCTLLVTLGTHLPAAYRGWRAVRVQRATSLRGIAHLADHTAAHVLLYDPEAWPWTPRAEQLHPVKAVCRAAALAHAQGKVLIATPAVDLVQANEPGRWPGGKRYHGFERTGWVGAMARCANGIAIQSQVAEADTTLYTRFVLTESRQARTANPHVWLFAGLSTNPGGRDVTPEQLRRVAIAVRGAVEGFWLNIPAAGRFCPRCGIPHPRRAYRLLQSMAGAWEPPLVSPECRSGCSTPAGSGRKRLEKKDRSMVWLFGASGLARLARAAGGPALLSGPLNHPTTWVAGKRSDGPPRATHLESTTNIARLSAMRDGVSVIVDIENWQLTPRWQRQHPVEAYRDASQLARRQHLTIIATPATDLVHSVLPLYRGNIYREFVKLQLARKIAPYALIYEIQAQNAEANPIEYRRFVADVATQVRSVNPDAKLLAGLTTNPFGKPESVAVLYRDIEATRGIVSGYWLNIPQAGRGCPRCGRARPEIAVRLLRRYFGKPQDSGNVIPKRQ